MDHILISSNELAVRLIWDLAKKVWPHTNIQWPEINLGIILGCGSVKKLPLTQQDENDPRPTSTKKGAAYLFHLLVTESAHLIWAIRCERVIQEKVFSEREIRTKRL
jgi:hypothetical protein